MYAKLVIPFLLITLYSSAYLCQDVTRIITDRKFLTKLLKAEPTVISLLQDYVNTERERLELIEKYIQNYENIFPSEEGSLSDFLDHPLNTYKAIKYLSREWTDIDEIINFQQYMTEDLIENIKLTRNNYEHSKFDLYNAGTGIHRLQTTYNLSIEDLAEGRIVSDEDKITYSELKGSKTPLDAFDCLQISLGALDDGYIPEAKRWVETADSKLKAGDESSTEEFLNAQREAIIIKESDKSDIELLEYFKEHKSQDLSYYLYHNEQIGVELESEMFRRLCRNVTLQFAGWKKELKCKLEHRNNSYLYLQPLKLEVASIYPRIEVIHDIVTDKQIDQILSRARAIESVSSEVNDEVLGINGVDATSRTSSHVWLSDEEGKDISKITDIIERATGLDASDIKLAGEPYQVANYATGGRYQPHPDYLDDNERIHPNIADYKNASQICGDRLATFMIYLNNVIEGGSTVFPDIGVSVTPRKGSAVFWWNMNKAGVADEYTRHGGCPVLYGSKWIMNKWFCQRPQVFKARCGLNEGDYF